MLTSCQQIYSLENLREYVQSILCQFNELEVGAFRMTERLLLRVGEPCGIFFCLHGPRSVKFTAVWETDRNTILFYGADGERFHKTQLVESPSLELSAA